MTSKHFFSLRVSSFAILKSPSTYFLLSKAASGPSSQPQTEAPTTSAPVDQFEGEDAAFHFSEIRDGVVNNFSNNHNGRSDGEIYTPPVKGSRAFYRTLISGGSVVSNHSNNNNAQGSVSNPMVVEVSRNLGA